MTSYSDPELDSLEGSGAEEKGESPAKENQEKSVDQEEQNLEETVVPMKVLMGKDGVEPNEGDEIVVKVLKKHGQEATIAYSNTDPNSIGKEEGYGKTKPGMTSDQELDELNKY